MSETRIKLIDECRKRGDYTHIVTDAEIITRLEAERDELKAKLEAMEREARRLTVAIDARDVTIKTMRQLAAAQQEEG